VAGRGVPQLKVSSSAIRNGRGENGAWKDSMKFRVEGVEPRGVRASIPVATAVPLTHHGICE